jgi:phosphoribosylamine--glycine ligase
MKILVVGGGGREHALAWKIAQSPLVKKLYAAPGNPGIARHAECLDINPTNLEGLAEFAARKKIDMTVVGPEGPLVDGIVDYFRDRKLPVFGPTKAAARLEGSKSFAKELMRKLGVPTASFRVFKKWEEAHAYIDNARPPIVVKADGLAGGKGVVVARNREEAKRAVTHILADRVFGDAGAQVVIEECLTGEEVSVMAVADEGIVLVPLRLLIGQYQKRRAMAGEYGMKYVELPRALKLLIAIYNRSIVHDAELGHPAPPPMQRGFFANLWDMLVGN